MNTNGEKQDLIKRSIALKPAQVKALSEMARERDLPVSWLIRKAVDNFISQIHAQAQT